MTEHTAADALIDSEYADMLIGWEVYASTRVAGAVADSTSVFGLTIRALQEAFDAVVAAIGEAVAAALRVGQAIAAAAYRLATGRRGRRPARTPRSRGLRAGLDIAGRVTDLLTVGVIELRRGADPAEVVQRTATSLQRLATTAVNTAATAVAEQVAAAVGAPGVVWIAERDACVHCLSLAGHTATVGGAFPPGSQWADRPLRWRGFTGLPPRHPACRCRAVPWDGTPDIPAALQREAQRSIVRGWSLPSESTPARLRAARRLLADGTVLPRSVERAGRDAVRAGGFPRGRTPPTATPQAA